MTTGFCEAPLAAADLQTRETLVAWFRRTAPHLSVGLMAADAMAYGASVKTLEEAGVNILHYDVMDGVFCPSMTSGAGLVKATRTRMLKDVHLMVKDALDHIPAIVAAGADIVHVHCEGAVHLHRALVALDTPVDGHEGGRKILRSVALNPGTPIEMLRPVLHQLEMVTFLAVDPGWGGGAPDEVLAGKINAFRKMAQEAGVEPLISIDGGIKAQTYPIAAAMKPDMIVSGSAVFKAGQTVAENLAELTRGA